MARFADDKSPTVQQMEDRELIHYLTETTKMLKQAGTVPRSLLTYSLGLLGPILGEMLLRDLEPPENVLRDLRQFHKHLREAELQDSDTHVDPGFRRL